MTSSNREAVERHIKTHSVRSNEDRSAVNILQAFLRSDGKINPNFAYNDKWPNTDGTFEFVSNPSVSKRPTQNFSVQIKGSSCYSESNGVVKYSLKSLAFPAYIYSRVTQDPGILFVVLNPEVRGSERVFWKYMSPQFVNSIDYTHDSVTIAFSSDEEILNTEESIIFFCDKLEKIINHHSFISQLENVNYSENDVKKIIKMCDEQITESIERFEIYDDTRDNISRRILTKLEDLCMSTLILNSLDSRFQTTSVQLAWERSMLNIETKYLGSFYRGLKYIGKRVPDEGQSERLMLKYYDFLWQIRNFLGEHYKINILDNLEKFPLHMDDPVEKNYYELISNAIDSVHVKTGQLRNSRYYVQKKVPFFVGKERYYEITLQLAGTYSTKYNRITAYTKDNISTNYSIKIGYEEVSVDLWGINLKLKVITNWKVSIDPTCLNKMAKVLCNETRISSNYGEYNSLMEFLTKTGMNFLDLIDLQEVRFSDIIDEIYKDTNTSKFKDILLLLRRRYSNVSKSVGSNTIRYLLINLREETLDSVLVNQFAPKILYNGLNLSTKCYPFENNPFISNLAGSKSIENGNIKNIVRAAGYDKVDIMRPYLILKSHIKQSGEIYFDENLLDYNDIIRYNSQLDNWERNQGYKINIENGHINIDSYEKSTIYILNELLRRSTIENKGQKEFNRSFLKNNTEIDDELKRQAIEHVFVNSQIILIYGAAGTGKTRLINYISNLMVTKRKLFLTKTHTAKQNLKRRIDNPGTDSEFTCLDSFTKKVQLNEYDIVFVDECSTIDNRAIEAFLRKLGENTFLVLAGDIYQIESIDFGDWFFYAKDIIKTPGANIELLNTWRTEDESLKSLWGEVRRKDALITEKLVIDGPFSENIGENIFKPFYEDEVVLCLNYDGKFGLNNMNNYFQNANKKGEAIPWQEWNYKVGDPILFNNSKRFPVLYNNLKGRIVDIEKENNNISFTIDVEMLLTENDCKEAGLEFIDITENTTRIRFVINEYYDSDYTDNDEASHINSVVPFQLAYAVSIHKAQGLEYDSVKVIIPNNNSEKITHGIFYTAITRAKKNLKIYWSSETMEDIVSGFSKGADDGISLDIIKSKLKID